MDTTTHALAGYMIAKTGIGRDTGKWGTIAGVTAAVLPDADLVLGFLGTEVSLKYHRHLGNSVFLIVPLSLVVAWTFVKVSGLKRFGVFFLIALVELLVHNFLDVATSYGTMIFSPFSNVRYALDWIFIVDLFMVSTLLVPMVALLIWKRRSRVLARISVVLAAIYVAVCAYNHSWALSLARDYAHEKNLVLESIGAIPQPLSPFRWANYMMTKDKIYRGFVDLLGRHKGGPPRERSFMSRLLSRYQPVSRLQYEELGRFDNSRWVEKARKLEGVETFFWFARFPVAKYAGPVNGNTRVEFYDLRFELFDSIRPPFVYAVDFDREGNVAFQGFL